MCTEVKTLPQPVFHINSTFSVANQISKTTFHFEISDESETENDMLL